MVNHMPGQEPWKESTGSGETGGGMEADPGDPSPEEMEQHILPHSSFEPWCEHCRRGSATRGHHRFGGKNGRHQLTNCKTVVVDTEAKEDGAPKFSIDPMVMTSRGARHATELRRFQRLN